MTAPEGGRGAKPKPLLVTEDGIVLSYAQARDLADAARGHPLADALRTAAARYWRLYP